MDYDDEIVEDFVNDIFVSKSSPIIPSSPPTVDSHLNDSDPEVDEDDDVNDEFVSGIFDQNSSP